MIDTLILRSPARVPLAISCDPVAMADTFDFHGMTADFKTTDKSSHFHKSGHRWMLEMQNGDNSIWIKGPVTTSAGSTTFVPHWIRLNMPKLAGLPEGCLPADDTQLRQALDKVGSTLHWMPGGWQQQATIRQCCDVIPGHHAHGHLGLVAVSGSAERSRLCCRRLTCLELYDPC